MAEYYADIRDMKFIVFEQLGIEKLFNYPKYSELDNDTVDAMIEEAYKFAKNEMGPINEIGDTQGAVFDPETGKTTLPKEFHDVYKTYTENGWLALTHDPEYGGMGMPYTMQLATNDFFFGSCLSFSLGTMLTNGTGHLVDVFGTDKQKEIYLEKLYTGKWAGTMCLTEAGAGTDVGAVRTKAKKEGDHYLIEGEKIFITFGDHDLTDNIIHAVLARIEGAPAGTRGLSLFIVPKFRVNDDGSMGEANDVRTDRLEEKMGIHASATTTLVFGNEGKCHGYLLGEENKGMRVMFQMMNEARISVGQQGSALGNAAYQYALNFAKERIQGKNILQSRDESAPSVPIINHPDVKRMLLQQKALSEGTRALLLKSAFFFDIAESSDNEEERKFYSGLTELLTPVCKAYSTDKGFEATVLATQTLGGYGYTKEYPVEQYLRDTKIASIYEGTNGVQALDLMGRKLPADGGKSFKDFIGVLMKFDAAHKDHPVLADALANLAGARDAVGGAAMYFATEGAKKPLIPILNATPFLELLGDVSVGWLLLEQATIAWDKLQKIAEEKGVDLNDRKAAKALIKENSEASFYDGKVKVAQFWATEKLGLCRSKAKVLMSGDTSALDINF